MSYDDWKTRVQPMKSGHGRPDPYPALRCSVCAFRGPLHPAVDHFLATGHPIVSHRGIVQHFEHYKKVSA